MLIFYEFIELLPILDARHIARFIALLERGSKSKNTSRATAITTMAQIL
jgi:hypothetical protein